MDFKLIPTEFITTALAAVGGLAKYLHCYLLGEPFVIARLFANIIISGFAGFMFAQFAQSFNASDKLLFVIAGVGGFMGASAIEVIQSWILSRFNLEKKP